MLLAIGTPHQEMTQRTALAHKGSTLLDVEWELDECNVFWGNSMREVV
jgi:hypothetical protein